MNHKVMKEHYYIWKKIFCCITSDGEIAKEKVKCPSSEYDVFPGVEIE